MSGRLLAAMLAAWLLHELGHWLALRSLGLGGRRHHRGLLGLAMEVPAACQGWRESWVALAGPAANLLALLLTQCLAWQELFAANFVLAGFNLLPLLPLDGGRALRGMLSGLCGWLGLSRFMLLWGKAAALAFAGSVYYFGLQRWLLLLALWLYLVAWREEQSLPYLLGVRLAAGVGQNARPRRRLRPRRDLPLYQLVEGFSPGWRNLVIWRGRRLDGDRLVEEWLAGGGAQRLSELAGRYNYAK